ncbi:MAG: DUF2332 domain-containing protein [Euryarchaeota archaeon]|jgi:hypothetical protein|nr:DUF2332 domain-containing protein [Euryarchaeota archaeon]
MTLAARFDGFADWCVGTSPLYERLARGVAGDAELLGLARVVPSDRSPPHVLLAAVHAELLRGVSHPLSTFYPSVADDPILVESENPFPSFRSFCLEHEERLHPILETRRTQTNAVRRCTALLPAFEFVSRLADREPLALIELGASAGLNLLFDRYDYEYNGDCVGNTDSPLCLSAAVRGDREPPIPNQFPRIDSRIGVDLNPLDVTDLDEARWLRALVWPEHTNRHRNLEQAISIAREDPPKLRRGDAVESFPDLLEKIPDSLPVCVFDTQLRYQLSDEQVEQLDESLTEAGKSRELYWLSGHRPAPECEHGIVLELGRVVDGNSVVEPIAAYNQHGAWIEWVGLTT